MTVYDSLGAVTGVKYYDLSDLSQSTDGHRDGYPLRDTRGGPTRTPAIDAPASLTLERFIRERVEHDTELTIQAVSVQRSDTEGAVQLSGDELKPKGNNPFSVGEPDLIYDPDSNSKFVGLIRPLLAGDPNDVNASDSFFTSGTLRISAYASGHRHLRPQISASPSKANVAQPVTFIVGFGGGDSGRPGTGATYVWSFGDSPAEVTGRDQTHVFKAPGRYEVQVTVQDAEQSEGTGYATVQVGEPPKPVPGNGNPGGGDNTGGTANGPRNGDGDTQGGDPNGKGGPAGNGGDAGVRGTGGSNDDGSTTTGTDAQGRSTTQQPGQAGKRKQQPLTSVGGSTVDGILLDAAVAQSVSAPSRASAAPRASHARRPTELPPNWRWLLVLVPVALIGGGMLRQTRWLAPRLPEPPWRRT